MGIAVLAFYLAFGVSINFNELSAVPGLNDKALLYAIIAAITNYFSALNRGTWRYVSIPDLLTIVKSAFTVAAVFTIILFMLSRADNLPRSVPPLAFLFSVFGMSASRLTYRLLKENGLLAGRRVRGHLPKPARNVMLIGASENAESFIRSVRRSETKGIRLIGMMDDRLERKLQIQGVQIYGKLNELETVISNLTKRGTMVTELIITDPRFPTTKLAALLTQATDLGLKVTRIPNLSETSELGEEKPVTKRLELSDLLGRNEYRLDSSEARRFIQGRTILITGAGGSIGSELARQVLAFNSKHLIVCDSSEFALYSIDTELREAGPGQLISTHIVDIRDRRTVFELIERYAPEVVFHAAALKHVPLMEANRLECLKTNVLGTRNVADAAIEFGVDTFVLISTDKAINPTNVMGASKRAAEVYCQSLDLTKSNTRFITVRFGNVLGSNGSVVPRFQKQIDSGGPVTVTHPEITRFFMTIPEAVRLVLRASSDSMQHPSGRGQIHVLDMGKPVRIDDLARKMIELSGLRPDIDIIIEYTGLRPGEKLYEELFDSQETPRVNNQRGYFIASPRIVQPDKINLSLEGIVTAIATSDDLKAIESLRIIVPEFLGPVDKLDSQIS